VHAGRDQFFCSDPKYVALDLQYGPDGAVYLIDWYDQQHCHNPNTERWDRSNGRIYRVEYSPTYRPAKADLAKSNDVQLVQLLGHKNAWFARTARRLLGERSSTDGSIDRDALTGLVELAQAGADSNRRLQALWTLHQVGGLTEAIAKQMLADPDEYVRGWVVQLVLDAGKVSPEFQNQLVRLARSDPSAVVRLYLASAIPRLRAEAAWEVIVQLAQHGEDRDDRNIPLLLWQGIAPRMTGQPDRAFALATSTKIPQLTDWVYWYAGTLDGDVLNRAVAALSDATGATLSRRLAGLWLAMSPRANVPMPPAWRTVAPALYANDDLRFRRQAEQLAAGFGDNSMFPGLRKTLSDPKADAESRKHAFAVLGRAQDRAALPVFLALLDDPGFRLAAIGLVARFDDPTVANELLQHIGNFPPAEREAALAALTSRPGFALALLDAMSAGKIKRDQLGAFQIRRLGELKNSEVDRRVASTWGRILKTPAEKQALIEKLEKTFDEAPLWAYESGPGRQHFLKLCATCHRIGDDGVRLGPELTGAGRNGIRYFLENIVDPDAVIGTDFQMTTIETKGGDTVSGLVIKETPSAVTIRTTVAETVVAKTDVSNRGTSEKSLMPEGLLESLSDREQIELLKFLTTH